MVSRSRSARTVALSDWRRTRLECLQAAKRSAAGSGAAEIPVRSPKPPSSVAGVAADDRAEQRVVVAAEVLRRAVQDEVGAVLERAKRMGVAAVESTTTGAGCAAAASKSGIVRNGFDGASSQTSCTPSGGAPVWSNST